MMHNKTERETLHVDVKGGNESKYFFFVLFSLRSFQTSQEYIGVMAGRPARRCAIIDLVLSLQVEPTTDLRPRLHLGIAAEDAKQR